MAVPAQALSTNVKSKRNPAEHEPQRELSGQRRHRKLLRDTQKRVEEFESIEHFRSELEDYLDYYNNHRIKLKLNGLTPAEHRSQAITIA